MIQIERQQTPTAELPVNQSTLLPLQLKLFGTWQGPLPSWTPVVEMTALRETSHRFGRRDLTQGSDPLTGVTADSLELEADADLKPATHVKCRIRGLAIGYDGRIRN